MPGKETKRLLNPNSYLLRFNNTPHVWHTSALCAVVLTICLEDSGLTVDGVIFSCDFVVASITWTALIIIIAIFLQLFLSIHCKQRRYLPMSSNRFYRPSSELIRCPKIFVSHTHPKCSTHSQFLSFLLILSFY